MKLSKVLFLTITTNNPKAKKLIFDHQKERNPNYAKFPVECDFMPDIDDACKDLKSDCDKKYISFACPTTCKKCL